MQKHNVAIAKIGRAHGLAGEVRVRFFSDDPGVCAMRAPFFTAPDANAPNARKLVCISHKPGNTMDIVRFKGVHSRQDAEALTGLTLYQARAEFAPPADDEYYYADLLGLRVLRASDRAALGTVSDIFASGASDILVVALAEGTREDAREGVQKNALYLPFTHAALPAVHIEEGYILAEDTYLL